MLQSSYNPYTSPKSTFTDLLNPAAQDSRGLGRALARWTLICTVSAAPSFFWGCMLHPHPPQIIAMLLGIVTFIGLYATVDCSPLSDRILEDPLRRRTVKIGYGTRLLISLLFPVGITLDMFLGAVAVNLMQHGLTFAGLDRPMDENAPLWLVYLTTLLQGVLLNVLLFAYMVVVWGIQWGLGGVRRGTPVEATVVESVGEAGPAHPFTDR